MKWLRDRATSERRRVGASAERSRWLTGRDDAHGSCESSCAVAARTAQVGVAVAATAGSGGVGVAACAPGHRSQTGPHSRPFLLHLPHLRAPLGRPRDLSVSTDSGGCRTSPAASPVGVDSRRSLHASVGRLPDHPSMFAPSVRSVRAHLVKRVHVLPDRLHCSSPVGQKYRRRQTSFPPTHLKRMRPFAPTRSGAWVDLGDARDDTAVLDQVCRSQVVWGGLGI